MQVDRNLKRHPGKHALLAYAENLVDNRAAIDRSLAAHLSRCAACQAEVRAVQASLSFAASAPELEPGGELTMQILLAGKQARTEMKKSATPLRMAWKVAQGCACAAGMVIVADGTDEAAARLKRVLHNDPGMGVIRHADAGYDIAKDFARKHKLDLKQRLGE